MALSSLDILFLILPYFALQWVGVVDMMDVLAVVVNCFEQEELESKGIDGILDQHLRFVEQV